MMLADPNKAIKAFGEALQAGIPDESKGQVGTPANAPATAS
jgi:hypothetical protein